MKISLSIVIPTYHRSEILKSNLGFILDSCKKYKIPIYISDDSMDSNTELTFKELIIKYPFISYHRNTPSLGHDDNLLQSLKLPNSDFVWLLGDATILKKDAISNMIDFLSQNHYDIVLVNADGREVNQPSKNYHNINEILTKFGWHSTLTGAAIYSKNVIELIDQINFNDYRNFPQFSLIYNYLSINCSFYWVSEKLISYRSKNVKSYWADDVFSTFINDWENAVCNLPESYDQIYKNKTIIIHSKKTKIFNLKSLLNYRMLGVYNWKRFKEYENSLTCHSNLGKILLITIAIFPRIIIKVCHQIWPKN